MSRPHQLATLTLRPLPSVDREEGFEVHTERALSGYVFCNAFDEWRPYSVWGRCLNAGWPGFATPDAAAAWLTAH
jgi:hypothetical protein